MKMKSCVRGIGLWAAALTLILSPMLAYADCEIVPIDGGYIIDCIEGVINGVSSGNGDDIITVRSGVVVEKTDQQSLDSIATSNAIAIDAGSGNNQVTDEINGSILATADADALPKVQTASQATANAAGISAEDGADVIQNSSSIAASAASNSESGDISLTLEGNHQFQDTTRSTATAMGIDAGGGNNQVINTGVIATTAVSEADASFINVDMGDSGAADIRTIANAIASGISGGNGEDEMTTSGGTITVNAAANVNNIDALVTIDVANESLVTGSSLSDASVTAEAVATGITGGAGDDTIVNDDTEITADADADATAVGVSLTISGSLEGNSEGKALSDSSTTANAIATGIDGGGGNDTIENRGKIVANADSKATAVGVGVDINVANEGSASGAALSDASVTAIAAATGIDGGEGDDRVENQGDIQLVANADATGVAVSADVVGTMFSESAAGSSFSDASVTAESSLIGIDGGEGDDTIVNEGSATTTNATASATGVSVALTVAGSLEGDVDGKALSDASVTAIAAATGIDGGEGDDRVENRGDIQLLANADATGVAVSVNVAGTTSLEGDVDGKALSDASVTAEAATTGIDGGSGEDTIDNWSSLSSEVAASATGVAVSVDVGGIIGSAAGSSVSDASVTAIAAATGIDGGEGDDRVENRGDIQLLANADATGVSVALDVAGTMKGSAAGSSVSDASVMAEATATGIDGGEGVDTIDNEGAIDLLANADAMAVSVALMVAGSMEGTGEGQALSDSSALAEAAVIGISGGAGSDGITNTGAIVAGVDATATSVGVGVDITLSGEGSASGSALSDAGVTASAAATGIDGGEDNDTINNLGDIDLVANSDATGVSVSVDVAGTMKGDAKGEAQSNSSVTAEASAIGIDGGEGDDEIMNDGLTTTTNATASATGVSVGLTVSGSMEGNVEGRALSDASALADASATGIDGGIGRDTIDNWSDLSSEVDASATGVAVSLKVGFTKEGDVSPDAVAEGSALSDASVTASTAATGIDGGEGSDTINNRGDIELLASSDATGVSVSVDVAGTMKGNAAGSSASDATVTGKSSAIGIDGGDGDDTIDNTGTITLMNGIGDDETDASATAVSVGLTVSGTMEGNAEGKALSDSSALADATATGIRGGSGQDTIENRGTIVADVDSSATAVGVSANIGLTKEGDVSGSALSDASVAASAAARGIDGGEGSDTIENRGDIDLLANSDATGVAVSVDVAGTMKGSAAGSSVSDASVTAEASAIGIDGGEGDDEITNDGLATTTDATASATGVSVGLTVTGSMEGNVEGRALSDASVTADAAATGIDGGSGQDTIENWSDLSSEVDASATGVVVSLKVGLSNEGDVSPDAVAEGSALSDASVTASAAATGIGGGEGSDTIENRGDIDLLANSDATGVSVALDVAGTMKGDAAGSSVSDASVTAKSSAIGIDGGDGNDTITNTGTITLMNGIGDDETDASATAVSVDLTVSGSMEGNVAGEALSNSSALADAAATGIKGGGGKDTINNRGAIVANVDSSATAVGVGLDVNLIIAKDGDAEGNVSGAALSDASVTANAAAKGIDGGEGKDTIANRGGISLSADSNATGVAVSLAVAGSVASKGDVEGEIEGKALSNATTAAYAEATGIDGGEDGDQIINTGNFSSLQAWSSSTGVSASVNISAGVAADGDAKVNVNGGAVSDARVTAEASVSAIRGGSGDDEVINAGDFVDIGSVAETTSVAASLEISGALAFKGDADASISGSAASAASANALTTTVAIDGGAGNDIINNTGNIIDLESDSTATSVSAGANVSAVVTIKGNAEADITGEAVGDSRVTAQAMALGLDGGLGDDEIDNEGDISLLSTADATGVAAELNVSAALSFKGVSTADVSGTAASNSAVLAKAAATGIDGGEGRDTILNSGNIALMDQDVGVDEVDASALGVSATLDISGNVAIKGVAAGTVKGAAASNATVTAEATATGIDGGGDNDIIDNTGAIKLLPSSNAVGVAASLNVSGNMVGETEGSAMSDASVIATSMATGINGGEGSDIISNKGVIILMKQDGGEDQIDANALGVAASLDITGNLNGSAEGQALSKTTTTADATATGISGGSGLDDITNRNSILADVDAEALGVAAALGITIGFNGSAEGAALSDASVTAEAAAIGIDGGEGADTIANQRGAGSESAGNIELYATSDAESVAVSVGITGTMRGTAEGKTVADASATANSTATGIDGGSGEDDITNMANIFANVDSHATAVGVSADITVSVNGKADGAALSDVSAESFSSAIGIDGAADNDTIDNQGLLDLYSLSDSQTTAVSVSLTGTMGGVAEGKSVSDGSAKAISRSTGIAGGEGEDIITNTNSINKITTFSNAITPIE